MADTYHPEVVFKVLKQVAEKMGSDNFPLRLLFVGKTTDTIKQLAHTYGAEACGTLRGVCGPPAKIVSYLKNTTGLLLVIPRTTAEKGILTGKLFEYLAAKKPIWAIGPPGERCGRNSSLDGCRHIFSRDQEQEMVAFSGRQNPGMEEQSQFGLARYRQRWNASRAGA